MSTNPPSRREFLTTSAGATLATITAGACHSAARPVTPQQLDGLRTATPSDLQNLVGDGRKRRILLREASCSASTQRLGTSRRRMS